MRPESIGEDNQSLFFGFGALLNGINDVQEALMEGMERGTAVTIAAHRIVRQVFAAEVAEEPATVLNPVGE